MNIRPAYSSQYPNVIAVGATDDADVIADYSLFGNALNVCAPGGGRCVYNGELCTPVESGFLWSTWSASETEPYYYKYLHGTSMATPLVTGTAALMLSVNPSLTPSQIRSKLQATADDFGPQGWDQDYGYGRINAYQALTYAPTPSLPLNAAVVSNHPTLTWHRLGGASSYRLQIASNSNFSNVIRDTLGITNTSCTITCLECATAYYWRVSAFTVDGTTYWSDARYFITQTLQLASPGDWATISNPPTLSWNSIDGTVSYRLQIATSNDFLNPVKDTTGITITSYVASGLANTQELHLQVFVLTANVTIQN